MSTNRADLVNGINTMMAAFIAAHPTVVKRHFRTIPESFTTDLPCTFLDLRPETISHESGLRQRTMSPSIVAVFDLVTNAQTTDTMDPAVDLLVDHFTTYPHLVAGTVWDAMTVSEESVQGDPSVIAVRFTFGNVSISEGRN